MSEKGQERTCYALFGLDQTAFEHGHNRPQSCDCVATSAFRDRCDDERHHGDGDDGQTRAPCRRCLGLDTRKPNSRFTEIIYTKLLTLPSKSPQLIKQGPCLPKILGIGALSEPVIDRQEKGQSILSPSLVVPEHRKILCSSKLQDFDVLASLLLYDSTHRLRRGNVLHCRISTRPCLRWAKSRHRRTIRESPLYPWEQTYRICEYTS
jgi:hypothetical protein